MHDTPSSSSRRGRSQWQQYANLPKPYQTAPGGGEIASFDENGAPTLMKENSFHEIQRYLIE